MASMADKMDLDREYSKECYPELFNSMAETVFVLKKDLVNDAKEKAINDGSMSNIRLAWQHLEDELGFREKALKGIFAGRKRKENMKLKELEAELRKLEAMDDKISQSISQKQRRIRLEIEHYLYKVDPEFRGNAHNSYSNLKEVFQMGVLMRLEESAIDKELSCLHVWTSRFEGEISDDGKFCLESVRVGRSEEAKSSKGAAKKDEEGENSNNQSFDIDEDDNITDDVLVEDAETLKLEMSKKHDAEVVESEKHKLNPFKVVSNMLCGVLSTSFESFLELDGGRNIFMEVSTIRESKNESNRIPRLIEIKLRNKDNEHRVTSLDEVIVEDGDEDEDDDLVSSISASSTSSASNPRIHTVGTDAEGRMERYFEVSEDIRPPIFPTFFGLELSAKVVHTKKKGMVGEVSFVKSLRGDIFARNNVSDEIKKYRETKSSRSKTSKVIKKLKGKLEVFQEDEDDVYAVEEPLSPNELNRKVLREQFIECNRIRDFKIGQVEKYLKRMHKI